VLKTLGRVLLQSNTEGSAATHRRQISRKKNVVDKSESFIIVLLEILVLNLFNKELEEAFVESEDMHHV
jgi:hypothetical protein